MSMLGAIAWVLMLGGASAPPNGSSQPGVRFLPEMWGEPQRRAGVLFQDGALATPVAGGTLWTFGDTFTGTKGDEGKANFTGAVSNTMALLKAGEKGWPPKLEYFSAGAPRPDGRATPPLSLLSDENEKTRRLWPLAGVWLEGAGDGKGRGYMFYGIIDVTGDGPWGFKPVGTGLARADKAFGPYERLPQPGGNLWGWPIDASAMVRRDGWLYLYAPRRFKGEKDLSSGLLIARVRESAIEDPGAYEFFAGIDGEGGAGGARWAKRVEEATPAADDVWGQASVAWNEHLHAYVLATSSNIFKHDEIRLRRSAGVWGPWTSIGVGEGAIKVPEREGEKTQLIYCTMLHPELDEEGGRVITLTFCRMLTREWALTNPEGVRVDLGELTVEPPK